MIEALSDAVANAQVDAMACCKAEECSDFPLFRQWLRLSHPVPKDLAYLERYEHARKNFEAILPGASFVIVAALALPKFRHIENTVKIARFAASDDYHFLMKEALRGFGEEIKSIFAPHITFDMRVCVDTAPILERYWAKKSGLASVLKSRMASTTRFGTQFVLGELVVDRDLSTWAKCFRKNLDIDVPACPEDCNLCVKACPGQALGEVYKAERCVSFMTTQYRGVFENPKVIGNRLWGCDICQDVCPLNRNVDLRKLVLSEREPGALCRLSLREILTSSSSALKKHLATSPLNYINPVILKRNALAVAANTLRTDLIDIIRHIVENESENSLLRTGASDALAALLLSEN